MLFLCKSLKSAHEKSLREETETSSAGDLRLIYLNYKSGRASSLHHLTETKFSLQPAASPAGILFMTFQMIAD